MIALLQYIIWAIAFITLYMALVWLNFLYLSEPKSRNKIKKYKVTVTVPTYNEEKNIKTTLLSLINLLYPKNRLEIIVADNGSTDGTKKTVKNFIKNHSHCNIKLISLKEKGKGKALNSALKIAKGDIFCCVDADTTVDSEAINCILPYFNEKKTAAVISTIKVRNTKNTISKIQRIEYFIATLTRTIMTHLDTLHVTPGAMSAYRTDIIKKIGGFDEKTLTEDFEIAMRLKYFNYNIKLESASITYTAVPLTLKNFWTQRIRWSRGFIENHVKYRKMFLSKNHGFFGLFQLPVNVIGAPLLVVTIWVMLFGIFSNIYEFILRSFLIRGYFTSHLFSVPSLNTYLLSQNMKILFPLLMVSTIGFYMIWVAHKQIKENFRFPLSYGAYLLILPSLTSLYWISAFFQEITKIKKKW